MAERRFDIIFDGSVINGNDVLEVKANLQQLFKLDDNSIDKLFSGTPIAIKKNLDRQTASQYQTALTQAGAKIQLVLHKAAADPSLTKQQAAAAPAIDTASDAQSLQILPPGSPILNESERVEITPAQINVDHLQLEKVNPFLADDLAAALPAEADGQYPTPNVSNSAGDHLTLAEPGATIGAGTDDAAVAGGLPLDIEHLDIDPLGNYLLSQAELAAASNAASTAVIDEAAIAALSLSEVGSDLLNNNEKPVHPAVDVDTSAFKLMEDNT